MTRIESEHNLEQVKETDKLRILIEKYKDLLGNFDLVPVGASGFMLQSHRQKPMAGNDWVFFDYDDTLVATTAIKEELLNLYTSHLESSGIQLTTQQAKRVMDLTDKFSRWEEQDGAGRIYHANAHMIALEWVTQILKKNNRNYDEIISIIQEKLETIKLQLTQELSKNEDVPFYFNQSNKKLILRSTNHIWSKDIEQIFMNTMINPPQYTETIQGAIEIGKFSDSIHRTNLGVFTYGDPYYQLLKTFELLTQQPDLAISQIWLTRRSKGDFIIQAAETKAAQHLEQEYVPAQLEDYEGESMSHGGGYVLSQATHTITMLDDDPRQLSAILESNEYLEQNTGAQFVVIRSVRQNTKEQHKEWHVSTQYGELDFTAQTLLPNDIHTIILINRFINTRARLGNENPKTTQLLEELQQKGISEIV